MSYTHGREYIETSTVRAQKKLDTSSARAILQFVFPSVSFTLLSFSSFLLFALVKVG